MELAEQLEQLHPASFAWALGCCDRDRAEAEEVLQNVYVKVLEGKARFNGRSSLKTWLFAVIRNTAAAHRRTRWLRSRLLFEHDPVIDVETRLVQSERTAQLRNALQRLAGRQREVLELVFYHDMSIAEAGQTLGISLGSARVHYERGKKNLSEMLT